MRTALASALFAAAAFPIYASAQSVVNESALSADAALEVATAALAYCRKEGQKVSVTVVDQAGRAKVVIRDDGAAPHTTEHSLRKAYTALTYRMPSARGSARSRGMRPIADLRAAAHR